MSQQGPKQRRRALKDAKRQRDALLSREVGDFTPPDRSDCDPKEWHQAVDDSATVRVSIWIWRHEGRLVDFVMRVETGKWDEPANWTERARIDCKGGRCHLHPPGDLDRHELILRLDCVDDVENAYVLANEVMSDVAVMIRDRRS